LCQAHQSLLSGVATVFRFWHKRLAHHRTSRIAMQRATHLGAEMRARYAGRLSTGHPEKRPMNGNGDATGATIDAALHQA
jgi:hypothetical protein